MNPFASLLLGLVSALGSRGAPQEQNALGAPNPQVLQSLLQMSMMSMNPIALLLSQTPRRNTSIPGGMFGMMPWAPPNPFIPGGFVGYPQVEKPSGVKLPFIPGGFVGYPPVEKPSGVKLPLPPTDRERR